MHRRPRHRALVSCVPLPSFSALAALFAPASFSALATLLALSSSPARLAAAGPRWGLAEMVGADAEGRTIYRARAVDERFLNPVDAAEERAFQARARRVIAEQATRRVPAGNTYFENEKRTYGYLMAQVLAGREGAVLDLQQEDAQAGSWHRHTSGIDYYACFTLKHQMRKYFYFGDLLEPEYRRRMLEGARAWTEHDPLRRPHPAHQAGKSGWGPDAKNSWVDVRSTENLYLMRVSSVYLMAEETGNDQVRERYRNEILRYAASLYRVGMGEWDSENYHGHSLPPLLNLYDFARDEKVKLAAKAALDWLFAAGAVKYFRGGFNGPTNRDYNHVQPFGGSAACMLWMHFDDAPAPNSHWESDEVHFITSAYRPPPAVVAFARKEFERPLEVFASKPHYSASTSGDLDAPPAYLETQTIGRTFQLGSLAGGTPPGTSAINGFKIVYDDPARGGRAIQCAPARDPRRLGSPAYKSDAVTAPNRVAQYRNLAIWLSEDGRSPWTWLLPEEVRVKVRTRGGSPITCLDAGSTWIAVHPIGTSALAGDEVLTASIAWKDPGKKKEPLWPDHQVLAAAGKGGAFSGFALEIGEAPAFADFAAFERKVLERSARDDGVDLSRLEEGRVIFTASGGRRLEMRYAGTIAGYRVLRDGKLHDWSEHARFLYRTAAGEEGPIHQEWLGGTLTVRAGGKSFRSTVAEDGGVTFANE